MIIRLTAEQYREADDGCSGFCRSCGEQQWGVEPDARGYRCESCGAMRVCGVADLLLSGGAQIVGSEDE